MSTTITAIFNDPADASAAIHTLESRGMAPSRFSIIANEGVSKDAFRIKTHTKLPEGVAIGASAGGAVGALVAGLTAVGAIATGGVGLIAAGPVVAALAGAGAGAAGGSVIGGGIGAAIPEHEVKHYENEFKRGAIMVGVECENSDEKSLVKDTFKHFDAEKISTA